MLENFFVIFDILQSKPVSCVVMFASAGLLIWRRNAGGAPRFAARVIAFVGIWAFCLFGPVFPNLTQFARIAQLNREGAEAPLEGFRYIRTLSEPRLLELLDASYSRQIRFAAATQLIVLDTDLRRYPMQWSDLPLFENPGYWLGWSLQEFSIGVHFPANLGEIRSQLRISPLRDRIANGTK